MAGAPAGSVSVLYTEKIVNYYVPTTTTSAVTLPAATVPVAGTSALPLTNGSITVSLGTAAGIVQTTCTGETATSLTGCTGGTGAVAKGSDVGAPGAAVVPYSTLALTGEGKNKPKSLFGNNEDLTIVRAAYTYDGLHFTDLGQGHRYLERPDQQQRHPAALGRLARHRRAQPGRHPRPVPVRRLRRRR